MNDNDTESFNIVDAQYVASAVKFDQYPEGELTEIAFIGRSNVGKSSLINSLCRRHGLARISSTPGKTQTLNFYRLSAKTGDFRHDFFLVDLPGYGYARTGRSARQEWSKFIQEYWLKSTRLVLVCQLIDIRHPPMASDVKVYEWLTTHNLPVQVVATKADKIAKGRIKSHLEIIRKEIKLTAAANPIIAFSAENGQGRAEILDVIRNILLK
ncbi:MAG TPA: ribosome biogenesis GTP-binding protein YihA/YsxC [Methylomusa anaerophila]|uniref:Probable GTP-binding protein EngB n=1 Tax=Methylomusa anaerophila TaxID=1930071 RepID=A0A348AFL1_9FIRM|nr:ribosome biogenesis GTP-binding protein YihA/YsxC [Methylomusa anaerophila]BBB89859.1 putative GTP-binding protein EngB [Methylomusa anaerophila]HML89095.1 ribosome biogenesis GTP-binding protein YihA/YsxC [Methylomusa anaerophila]